MPRRESYAQGTPNWVVLRANDIEAAKLFYGSLFGWTYEEERGPDGERIAIARKDDADASGIVAAIAASPDETFPPAVWNTYLTVDNVHTAVARTITGGGTVVQAPIEVDDAGVLAVVTDAGGAPLGLWQARNRIGATLVNEAGAVIWNELTADDLESARVFYDHVFGLSGEISDPGSGAYITFKANGDPVAGACARGGARAPSHWHVYFAVADAAPAPARAVELGGDVLAGPMATAIGPMAALRDSLGAMFSVFEVPSSEIG
jgi:predicted enzyme related to lactoylglutathione lyase